jgi:hypothetical protein
VPVVAERRAQDVTACSPVHGRGESSVPCSIENTTTSCITY